MLGFVDESGDTGFRFDRNSSPYFVVAMVLVPGADEAEKLRLAMDELKEGMRKPSMEFHFTNTDGATRQKFFNTISNHDFKAVATVCDKGKLRTLKGDHTEFLLSTFGPHSNTRGIKAHLTPLTSSTMRLEGTLSNGSCPPNSWQKSMEQNEEDTSSIASRKALQETIWFSLRTWFAGRPPDHTTSLKGRARVI